MALFCTISRLAGEDRKMSGCPKRATSGSLIAYNFACFGGWVDKERVR